MVLLVIVVVVMLPLVIVVVVIVPFGNCCCLFVCLRWEAFCLSFWCPFSCFGSVCGRCCIQ